MSIHAGADPLGSRRRVQPGGFPHYYRVFAGLTLQAMSNRPEILFHLISNRLVMPTCENCGSFVTREYVRVFAPNGMDSPRVCPNCEDKVRDGADVREARATRH